MARATTKRRRPQKRAAKSAPAAAKAAPTARETPASAASERANPEAPEQLFDSFVQSNEAILAGMAALNAEMANFCNRRLRDNVERSGSLMECRDADEAFKIQWDFCQRATEQYLNQTSALLGIMARMTEDFFAPLQEQQRQVMRRLSASTEGGAED